MSILLAPPTFKKKIISEKNSCVRQRKEWLNQINCFFLIFTTGHFCIHVSIKGKAAALATSVKANTKN